MVQKVDSDKINSIIVMPENGVYSYIINYKFIKASSLYHFIYIRVCYTDEFNDPSKDTLRLISKIKFPPALNDYIFDATPDEQPAMKQILMQSNEW